VVSLLFARKHGTPFGRSLKEDHMQHFAPRQRSTDGRWDYTRTHDKKTIPVGYCGGWTWDVDIAHWEKEQPTWHMLEEFRKVRDEQMPLKDRFHTDGHATEEEAQGCYKKYLLDTCLRLDAGEYTRPNECLVCGEWTQKYASVGGLRNFDLCDTHRTRENVEKILTVGTSWES